MMGSGHGHEPAPAHPADATAHAQIARVPDRCLGRTQRVRQARIFREAYDTCTGFAGRWLVLRLWHGEDAALRLGVVASRRSFPRAVDRNRAKRLMREAFRLNRHRLQGNCDVILMARMPIIRVTMPEVARELLYLAGKAGLLRSGASPRTQAGTKT